MSIDDIYEDCAQADHTMCNSFKPNPFFVLQQSIKLIQFLWYDIEYFLPFPSGCVPDFYDEYQLNTKPMILIENCA